jgi:hypothetical protein
MKQGTLAPEPSWMDYVDKVGFAYTNAKPLSGGLSEEILLDLV